MGSFSTFHWQILIGIAIFILAIVTITNKKTERKKFLYASLAIAIVAFLILKGEASDVTQQRSAEKIKAIVCEQAKAEALNKCLNMQTGAAGMASCNGAVEMANAACERNDLTIMNILDEASKGAQK